MRLYWEVARRALPGHRRCLRPAHGLGTERTLVIDLAEDVEGPLEVPLTREVRADGPRRWLQFNRDEITAAELIADVAARYAMRDLTIEEPAIETIVRHIYEHGLEPVRASAR